MNQFRALVLVENVRDMDKTDGLFGRLTITDDKNKRTMHALIVTTYGMYFNEHTLPDRMKRNPSLIDQVYSTRRLTDDEKAILTKRFQKDAVGGTRFHRYKVGTMPTDYIGRLVKLLKHCK